MATILCSRLPDAITRRNDAGPINATMCGNATSEVLHHVCMRRLPEGLQVALGVVVFFVATALALLWLVGWPFSSGGTIDGATFFALRFGETRSEVIAKVGSPAKTIHGVSEMASDPNHIGTPAIGVDCDVYDEEAIQDPSSFELCYRDGALVQKVFQDGMGPCVPVFIDAATKFDLNAGPPAC